MKDELVNIEEAGFTPEDLENAGVELEETTEETNTQEGVNDVPSTETPESDANDAEVEPEAPETNEGETEKENHANDQNLKAALAQERARRKAAEERARQFEAQQKPIELPQEEVSNIRDFVRREALKRFNMTAEDLESLMFEDAEKYNAFIRFEANAEYAITNQQIAVHQQRQTNLNFVNEIKSLPNFGELYQRGLDKLNGMTMRDAQPINDAFYRVDQGEGTESDFETIRKFVKEVQNELATSTEVPNNPLEVAATLPKAGALNGGVPTPNKVTEEDILKAYDTGNLDALPKEIRDYLDEL
ncbi:hypothetical protein [Veillonella sp. AF36-20BH]|uniref:hypothetical protein n=1 Tax=Veillonella sp. AF36-20BH TaxID=2293251 RepID=UPI000E73F87B|nr:hypothetical protein [Veillonella sp. AF36-20BH]RJU18427.1 hypothetical protein DW000_00870 [Veillonella sp. AF36-20BH]